MAQVFVTLSVADLYVHVERPSLAAYARRGGAMVADKPLQRGASAAVRSPGAGTGEGAKRLLTLLSSRNRLVAAVRRRALEQCFEGGRSSREGAREAKAGTWPAVNHNQWARGSCNSPEPDPARRYIHARPEEEGVALRPLPPHPSARRRPPSVFPPLLPTRPGSICPGTRRPPAARSGTPWRRAASGRRRRRPGRPRRRTIGSRRTRPIWTPPSSAGLV